MPSDLHVHTTSSDGLMSGPRVVETAAARGLRAVAITDHNAISAVPGAQYAAARWGVEVVPGAELDCDLQGALTHVVGLFLEVGDPAFQRDFIALQDAWRQWIRDGMEELAGTTGIRLAWEDVDFSGDVPVGGDVLTALHRAGHEGPPVSWGDPGTPTVALPYSMRQVCDLIHRGGGVAILAHPWKHIGAGSLTSEAEFAFLRETGVDGWECWRLGHTPEQTEYLLGWGRRLGLLPSGGSDYHKPRPWAEAKLGHATVPDEAMEALRAKAGEYK